MTGGTHTAPPRSETARTIARWIVTVAMVGVGITHFTSPEFFLAIMPPWLPWHRPLVYISGVAEIALGLAVLFPATGGTSSSPTSTP